MVNTNRSKTLRHAQNVKDGAEPDALLNSMVLMFQSRGGELAPDEEKEFSALVIEMAGRARVAVRQKLAMQMAGLTKVPHGILEYLAHDEISVAKPILSQSMAVDEKLLLDVITQQGASHATAIAARPSISAPLCAAIAETESIPAVVVMLRNAGAEIEGSTFDRMSECARKSPMVQKAMIKRDDLPVVIAQQLFWIAQEELRQETLDRFSFASDDLDGLLKEAVANGLADPDVMQFRKLIHKSMRANGLALHMPVTETIGHIKAGRIADFAKGVSGTLTVRKSTIQKILTDEGGEALAVMCKALDADRVQFTAALLTNDYRQTGVSRPSGEIERVSNIYDLISTDEALATVQMWDALLDKIAA